MPRTIRNQPRRRRPPMTFAVKPMRANSGKTKRIERPSNWPRNPSPSAEARLAKAGKHAAQLIAAKIAPIVPPPLTSLVTSPWAAGAPCCVGESSLNPCLQNDSFLHATSSKNRINENRHGNQWHHSRRSTKPSASGYNDQSNCRARSSTLQSDCRAAGRLPYAAPEALLPAEVASHARCK